MTKQQSTFDEVVGSDKDKRDAQTLAKQLRLYADSTRSLAASENVKANLQQAFRAHHHHQTHQQQTTVVVVAAAKRRELASPDASGEIVNPVVPINVQARLCRDEITDAVYQAGNAPHTTANATGHLKTLPLNERTVKRASLAAVARQTMLKTRRTVTATTLSTSTTTVMLAFALCLAAFCFVAFRASQDSRELAVKPKVNAHVNYSAQGVASTRIENNTPSLDSEIYRAASLKQVPFHTAARTSRNNLTRSNLTGGNLIAVKSARRASQRASSISTAKEIENKEIENRAVREIATEFLPVEDARGVPLESGQIVRVELPRSALTAFGLPLNQEQTATTIKADAIIGNDGIVHAIRFVR